MAAELITPTDEISGLPLPILPREVLPDNFEGSANWHHHWHPESAPALSTPGGKAVRHSRVQLVRETDHNMGDKQRGKLTYHDYYVGPELPTDEAQQFGMTVLACAGYVPSEAIDLRGDEPRRVRMTEEQTAMLRLPGSFAGIKPLSIAKATSRARQEYQQERPADVSLDEYISRQVAQLERREMEQAQFTYRHLTYRYEPIRDFFRLYALGQDLSHVNSSLVDEFLTTAKQDRKTYLGNYLLAQAIDVAAEPVEATYRQIRQAGQLHPLMPAKPRVLVRYKLGNAAQRQELVPQLAKVLAA